MKAAFVDQVADLPENRDQYPAALPQRLHPDGLGRNMTMFLVMKRWEDLGVLVIPSGFMVRHIQGFL